MTISIYAVLAAFAIYFSAALGACFDLSLDENGKADFDKLANSLEATLMNTDLVFEQLKKGEKALQFPIFAAFGIGLYALMKVTNKKKFHRKGEEHGSARWANQKEIKSLLDKPPKQKKENIFKRIFIKIKGWFKARDKPEITKNSDKNNSEVTEENANNSAENISEKSEKNTKIKMSDIPKLRAAKKEHEYIIDNNIVLTNDVKMSLNTRQTRKNLNVMVIGGSGSGKSRFYVKPNLMQANTSYVCTDPKGELLRSTGKMLKHYGYKIKVFNLIDMAHSNNYNPFQYIYDTDGNYSATAVIKMVNVLMKNTSKEGGDGGDQFWTDSTKALLAALCFYLVECESKEMQNFSEVMKLLKKAEVKEGEDNFQSDLDLIFDALEFPEKYTKGEAENNEQFQKLNLIDLAKKAKPASQYMCLKYYKDFKKAAGDTAKSILISTAVRLQAFNIPEVMDLTCCDNLHLEELGDEKQVLYIIIPSSDDTFNFLATMMYTQMFDVLYDRANFKYGGRLPVHVRCLLDEFNNIGQIPRFEELLATMRSMEISANVIIQNISQLKKMYKDSWENVLGNCDSLLFLGGQEPTTLEHISKTLGKETIDTRSNNRTRGRNGSTSENDGILGRELMTVDELKIMKDNECILFVRGLYPFFCDKFVIEKHPNYKLLEDFDSRKEDLIKRGIPRDEICFAGDAKTDKARAEMFEQLRKGEKRFILASTSKLGTGANVQDRICAIHHLDIPWKPSDISQQDGRGIRQGNTFDEVGIYHYLTEETFDAYLMGIITNKAKFINQIMTSKDPVRVAEDVDKTVLTYSQMQAVASGNPLIMEKIQLDNDIANLKTLEAEHKKSAFAMQELAERKLPSLIENYADLLQQASGDLKKFQEQRPENADFSIELNGKIFDERAEAGEEFEKAIIKCSATGDSIKVGKYFGFDITVEKNRNTFNLGTPCIAALNGNLKYTCEVSLKNEVGNMRRIENLAGSQINQKIQQLSASLDKAKNDLAEAKANAVKPFERAAELEKMQKRLEVVNAELSEKKVDMSGDDDEPIPVSDVPDDNEPAKAMSVTISIPAMAMADTPNVKPKPENISEQRQNIFRKNKSR